MEQSRRTTEKVMFLQSLKKLIVSFVCCLPMSFLGLLLMILLIYNSFSVFSLHLDSIPPIKSYHHQILHHHPSESESSLLLVAKETSLGFVQKQTKTERRNATKSDSSAFLAVKETSLGLIQKQQNVSSAKTERRTTKSNSSPLLVAKEISLGFIQKQNVSSAKTERRTTKSNSSLLLAVQETSLGLIKPQNVSSKPKRLKTEIKLKPTTTHRSQTKSRFKTRIKSFLSKSSCTHLFFMTWISSIESFGNRERFTIESLFKSHPKSCLIIVSNSLDSNKGTQILKPFTDKSLKILPIKPDFTYIFKDTSAETWYQRLNKGMFNPGSIPIEQNLSNLLRLVLLYKYGGIYLDTDIIILKSLTNLHNVIGAQTVDSITKKWSRLNNAVLIFDKNHPLLKHFIDEFSRTFNGNKWGHNGPYLVSRVVSRLNVSDLGFSVLPPSAFYPVDWTRIKGFYKAAESESEGIWLKKRVRDLRRDSFGVHLWNRESKKLRVEEGSIIQQLMSDSCIFCNSSYLQFQKHVK